MQGLIDMEKIRKKQDIEEENGTDFFKAILIAVPMSVLLWAAIFWALLGE